jgi:hypothetical protein
MEATWQIVSEIDQNHVGCHGQCKRSALGYELTVRFRCSFGCCREGSLGGLSSVGVDPFTCT